MDIDDDVPVYPLESGWMFVWMDPVYPMEHGRISDYQFVVGAPHGEHSELMDSLSSSSGWNSGCLSARPVYCPASNPAWAGLVSKEIYRD
jgi:hypothetical protein